MANFLPPGLPRLWENYRKRIESDIADLKRDLAPLESGKIRLRSGGRDGVTRDVTAHWIDHFRRKIKDYESMLVALKREELQ